MRKKFCLGIFLFLFSSLLKIQNVSAVGPFAYITNSEDGTVSVIDTASNTVSPVPIKVCCDPYGVAVASRKQRVYVTHPSSDKVSVIDISITPSVVIDSITVKGAPRGIIITPDEKKIYVTSTGVGPFGNVSVIDTETNAVMNHISIDQVGSAPWGIVATPHGEKIYVTNSGSDTVAVIDTSIDKIIATVPVGSRPIGIAVSPDGKNVYVTNNLSRNVSVINTETDTVKANPIAVGEGPYGVTVTLDGKKVYVVNYVSNNVSVIDSMSNEVTATVHVGVGPLGISLSPNGKKAYVVNNDFNNVSIIDVRSDTEDSTVQPMLVGKRPVAFGNFVNNDAHAFSGVDVHSGTEEPDNESTLADKAPSPLGNVLAPSCSFNPGISSNWFGFISSILLMLPCLLIRLRKSVEV